MGQRRAVNKAFVTHIATNYDPALLGVLVVGPRQLNNKYKIADGQHRCLGLRERGWKDEPVPCLVVREATTAALLAETFLGLQQRLGTKPVDKLLSEIVAERPEVCAINDVVRRAGYRIGHTTTNEMISAATALRRVHSMGGVSVLEGTLTVTKDAWGKTAAAVNGQILEGIGLLLSRFTEIDRASLSKKLRLVSGGPDGIRATAMTSRSIHGSTNAQNIAAIALTEYNSGKKTNRLPDWWATR